MTELRLAPSGPIVSASEVPALLAAVPDVASLVALSGAQFGQLVRVETLGRSFVFVPLGESLEPFVLIGGQGGNWQGIPATSDAKWLAQPEWYIDGVAGNDEFEGTALAPLQTLTEMQRRWGTDPIVQQVTTVRCRSAPSDGQFYLRWRRVADDVRVDVIDESPRAELGTGVLASYAPYSIALNDCIVIQVTGIDFSALQDKRINFGAQGVARVVHANPDGLGVSYARITQPYVQGADWRVPPAPGLPVVGQTVTVEELGIPFDTGMVDVIGGFAAATVPPFGRPFGTIAGFRFLKSFAFRGAETAAFNALRLVDTDARDIYTVKAALGQFGGSYSAAGLGIINHLLVGVLVVRGPDGAGLRNVAVESSSTGGSSNLVFRNVNMLVYTYANISQTAFFDSTSLGALQVHNGGMVYSVLGIVGKNNAIGIVMNGVSRLVASGSGGIAQLAIAGTQKINIPGGTLNSVADLPRKFDRGGGEVILVAGTASVTIEALPADTVVIPVRKTLGGVPGVNLTYSIAGNVITFLSDSAADTSTIAYVWFSPSTRAGLISS